MTTPTHTQQPQGSDEEAAFFGIIQHPCRNGDRQLRNQQQPSPAFRNNQLFTAIVSARAADLQHGLQRVSNMTESRMNNQRTVMLQQAVGCSRMSCEYYTDTHTLTGSQPFGGHSTNTEQEVNFMAFTASFPNVCESVFSSVCVCERVVVLAECVIFRGK